MTMQSYILGYSIKDLAILNRQLQKNPDVCYWGANTLRDSRKMVNKRWPYEPQIDINQKSLSFTQSAMDCNLSAIDVESKLQFYSDSHACQSSLETSGKSMNTNYRKTLDCANYLCNQRGNHAVGLMEINILTLKIYYNSMSSL